MYIVPALPFEQILHASVARLARVEHREGRRAEALGQLAPALEPARLAALIVDPLKYLYDGRATCQVGGYIYELLADVPRRAAEAGPSEAHAPEHTPTTPATGPSASAKKKKKKKQAEPVLHPHLLDPLD